MEDELWDLEALAGARRLCDWMHSQFASCVASPAVEVGAGIGTFSERLLADGVGDLLLIEPEPACQEVLRRRFGTDPRVTLSSDLLPGSPDLAARAGSARFVLCQNVLEHIPDDAAAFDAMARSLAPGGVMTVLVPAHPRLFGRLDRGYGHVRRYTRDRLSGLAGRAGLEVVALHSFNALGIAGWVAKNVLSPKPRIDPGSLRAYESLVRLWRPVEERLRPPLGLSLVLHARRAA